MRIYNYKKGILRKRRFLYEALELDLNIKNIISFVGAGGKTTSIYALANELSNIGKKVIVTTTTHMLIPENNFIEDRSVNAIEAKLKKNNIVTVGKVTKNNKFTAISKHMARELIKFCDFLIVEADGAKKFPLKAPAEYEPVIFQGSNIVVGVAGLDSLGKSIEDICHRPEVVSRVLGVDINHIIKTKDIIILLSSHNGQMKNVICDQNTGVHMEYRVIINKVDDEELLDSAKYICWDLENKKIKSVITTFTK